MSVAGTNKPSVKRRRSIAQRADHWLARLEQRAVDSGSTRIRIGFYLARLTIQVIQQWVRDRCPQQAASLAFQTVLSIVPVLAVATAALRALGAFRAQSSFVDFLTVNLIPVSREELAGKLEDFSRNITFESVGLAGLAASVVLAFVMFNSLEKIMNYVWRSERKRKLTQKFAIFYLSLTLVPVLIGVSLVEAARFGLTSGITGALFGFASTFLALLLANLFVPIPKVKLVPAIVGASVTTVLFEIAKLGYSAYVGGHALDSYSGIYGAVAIVPLTLVWIYYSWMMLLLGVEVAHAVQNLRILENSDRRSQMGLASEMMSRMNGVVASRVMVAVTASFERGDKVLSRQAISDRFDLSDEVTNRLVERLVDADLLMVVEGELSGVAPARPPEHVYLADVLQMFRGDDVDFDFDRPGRAQSPLEKILKDIEDSTHDKAMVTLAELVPSDQLEEAPGALADGVEAVADEQDADAPSDP